MAKAQRSMWRRGGGHRRGRVGGSGQLLRLSSIPSGGRCLVRSVQIDGVMRRRLMDLGLVPDAEVLVMRRAPLLDPIEVRIGNAYVALRREEAERIEVVSL